MRSASALRRLWNDLGVVARALAPGGGDPGALSVPAFLAQARALFVDGGITVETPPATAPGMPLLARSLIQPDGDVVHVLSSQILGSPSDWQAHRRGLERCYLRLEAVLALGRLGFRALVLAAVTATGLSGLQSAWPPGLATVAGIVVLLAAPFLLRRVLAMALGLWINRALG